MNLSALRNTQGQIRRLRLTQGVLIKGPDYWGRKDAWLRFRPINRHGWYWQSKRRGIEIGLTSDLAATRSRTVVLRHDDAQLHVYEHIGALRWTGLDSIVVESSPWPPFHGRPRDLWDRLEPFLEVDEGHIPWVSIKDEVRFAMPKRPHRFVLFGPLEQGKRPALSAKVIINYRKLGRTEILPSLPDDDLEPIFEYRSQGIPLWSFQVSRVLTKLHLWPHHGHITWAHGKSPEIALEQFALHRFLDLLGALSLVDYKALPAGHVTSHMGGHLTDIGLIQMIDKAEPKRLEVI